MAEHVRIRITQEDLLRLDAAHHDDFWIEVDDNAIIKVVRQMTFFHMLIIQNLFRILDDYAQAQELGDVFIDGGRYILAEDKHDVQRAYKPDLSFMKPGRIPEDFDWHGDFEGAPDLAVEVISPGQGMSYFVRRIERYLAAGVEEVWLIDPMRRELHHYRTTADTPRIYTEDMTAEFNELFPGFKLVMADVFRTPKRTQK